MKVLFVAPYLEKIDVQVIHEMALEVFLQGVDRGAEFALQAAFFIEPLGLPCCHHCVEAGGVAAQELLDLVRGRHGFLFGKALAEAAKLCKKLFHGRDLLALTFGITGIVAQQIIFFRPSGLEEGKLDLGRRVADGDMLLQGFVDPRDYCADHGLVQPHGCGQHHTDNPETHRQFGAQFHGAHGVFLPFCCFGFCRSWFASPGAFRCFCLCNCPNCARWLSSKRGEKI